MSYIVFDYVCGNEGCYAEYPNKMVRRSEMDNQVCDRCYSTLKRLPAGPITNFKFGDRAAIKSKKAVSLRDKN